VVEDTDADDVTDLAQAASDLDVFFRRRRVAGRVVVTKNHSGNARAPDDLVKNVTRVHDAGREGTERHKGVAELPVFVVQVHDVEMFARLGGEMLAEVGVHVVAAAKRFSGFEFRLTVALRDLEDGAEAIDCAGREAVLKEFGGGEDGNLAEAVVLRREPLTAQRGGVAEHGGEQLGVTELCGELVCGGATLVDDDVASVDDRRLVGL